MDPLEAEICRLCFSNDNILYHLHHDLEADVRDILSKHFGEVSDFLYFLLCEEFRLVCFVFLGFLEIFGTF